jgi:hypothetical protein
MILQRIVHCALALAVFAPGLAWAPQYQPAKFLNKTSCGPGTFHDPRNGGECWSCPPGFGRSATPVTDCKACQKAIIVGPFSKATFHGKAGKCQGPDNFFDPRQGGECWSCPMGHVRTLVPVTDAKACEAKDYSSALTGSTAGLLYGGENKPAQPTPPAPPPAAPAATHQWETGIYIGSVDVPAGQGQRAFGIGDKAQNAAKYWISLRAMPENLGSPVPCRSKPMCIANLDFGARSRSRTNKFPARTGTRGERQRPCSSTSGSWTPAAISRSACGRAQRMTSW